MKLTATMEKYILHWGEMGSRWGVNRTVAQIHALLYLSPNPLSAEEIADTLGVARSNVSTSIKELQSWNLIRTVNVMGDRRDYFDAMSDLWDMFMVIMAERKKREIDPTMTMLRECILEADEDKETPAEIKERMANVLDFMVTLTGWYDQIKEVPTPMLAKLMKLGGKVTGFLGKRKS